jgi:hypothetical protein
MLPFSGASTGRPQNSRSTSHGARTHPLLVDHPTAQNAMITCSPRQTPRTISLTKSQPQLAGDPIAMILEAGALMSIRQRLERNDDQIASS